MSKQKQKGTAFERMVVEYLSHALDAPEIERRTIGGTKDRGDEILLYPILQALTCRAYESRYKLQIEKR